MRIKRVVPIGTIVVDRWPMNKTTLDLVDFLRRGGKVPPIKVKVVNHQLRIKDGRHRVLAYKLLGIPGIQVTYAVKKGSRAARRFTQVPKATNPEAHEAPFYSSWFGR